jgi:hypothetical protein
MACKYVRAEPIRVADAGLDERWLQDRVFEDPSILGLGEVEVIDRERRQDKAGRLDLLLYDSEEGTRYEVELMLGPTDESHIIRCIEYWDIERRRYPGYDHRPVIVAEAITTRFLNVLGLFAGTIPIIAVQLNALKLNDGVILDFVKVLDQASLRRDDETEVDATPADRGYWNDRATPKTVGIVDKFLDIINTKAEPKQQLRLNRYYIGLHDGKRVRNFIYFKPKKQFTHLFAELPESQKWAKKLEEAGLPAVVDRVGLRVTIKPKEFELHRELLRELALVALAEHQKE